MTAVLNLGGNDLNASSFVNVLKAGIWGFGNLADVSLLDDDGYLTGTPAGGITISYTPNATFKGAGITYKLAWPSTRSTFTWVFSSGIVRISKLNESGTGNTVTAIPGLAGWVTFTVSSSFTIQVGVAGQTYASGSGEIALYRLSDETDYLNGEYFTPEFKALISGLSPGALRFMGWVVGSGNLNNETTWNYRVKPTSLVWCSRRFPPSVWGGTISGTNTYTINPGSGSPGVWTDGEVLQGVVTNANTITTPTLTVSGRSGTKTIVNTFATALSAGNMAAGAAATFVYDGLLDKVIWASNGATSSIPIEAQAQLCNRINANLWGHIPYMASDDYVTQWATAALNNLSSSLYFYPEYSNEVWNFSFPQNGWATARGTALGFSNPQQSWYGLRVRQIMGNLIPAVWSGRMSQLRRTLMHQAAGDVLTLTYRMKGADLAPSGTSTGTGNATYISWTGGVNYTAKPNRPIDVVETIGYAPYAGATNLYFGPDISGAAPTALNTPFYQSLVNYWEGGNSAAAIALIDADIRGGLNAVQTVTASGTTFTTPLAHGFSANNSDVAFTVTGGTSYSGLTTGMVYRVSSTPSGTTFTIQAYGPLNAPAGANINAGSAGTGTVSVGWMGGQSGNANVTTMQRLCSRWYVFGEYLAAQFDGDRPGGMSLLRVEQYEGALEVVGPSSAQLTTLGVTGATPKASIDAAIEAWKSNPMTAETQRAYYRQFLGLDPSMPTYGTQLHSQSPAHLVLQQSTTSGGAGWPYALIQGFLGSYNSSTPYELYDGVRNYDTNKRRIKVAT
jgi:hypothetical protein